MIGIGGAVALLLTARRQRYTELALVHTDRDATERRITELYTKAAELLGSDQAPVRLTAQNILSRNLHLVAQPRRRWWHRTPPNVPAWPGIGLDLTGALLLEFSLTNCQLDYADFTHAQFIGGVFFERAQVAGRAYFEDAQFTDDVDFSRAEFTGSASFERVRFTGGARFLGRRIHRRAHLRVRPGGLGRRVGRCVAAGLDDPTS